MKNTTISYTINVETHRFLKLEGKRMSEKGTTFPNVGLGGKRSVPKGKQDPGKIRYGLKEQSNREK